MSIHIVDSIMGSGKTTWAFKYMNEHPEKKYVYITPFLEECERVQRECPRLHFCPPFEFPSKQYNFIKLAEKGRNIATTHQLISKLKLTDKEYASLQQQRYTFILDEVVETVQPFTGLKEKEFQQFVQAGVISISEDGNVHLEQQNPYDRYRDVFDFIKAGSVFHFEKCCLLWTMPISILELPGELYVMTFLFEASHLKHTFDMFEKTYDYYHIEHGEIVQGKQPLSEKKQWIHDHIEICNQKDLNSIGDKAYALSSNKWKKMNATEKQQVTNRIRNYFSYKATGERLPANQCLWAVYGETEKKSPHLKRSISVKDYDTSVTSFNNRATNKFCERYYLAYPVNIFEHVEVKEWFKSKGQELSDDLFALSTMLQWIWRSAIRNGHKVYLYLPSKRMRKILLDWLENEDKI